MILKPSSLLAVLKKDSPKCYQRVYHKGLPKEREAEPMDKVLFNDRELNIQKLKNGKLRLIQLKPYFRHISTLYPCNYKGKPSFLFDEIKDNQKTYYLLDGRTYQIKEISREQNFNIRKLKSS